MLIHNLYPIGATVKNLHTGVIATIKEHGCTSSTDEGIELMLWMEGGKIWASQNVEIMDTPNTAEAAQDFFNSKRDAGVFGFTINARVTFESLLNVFMPAVKRVSICDATPNLHSDYTIDFNDGSLLTIKLGDWAANGFYIQIQDRRA